MKDPSGGSSSVGICGIVRGSSASRDVHNLVRRSPKQTEVYQLLDKFLTQVLGMHSDRAADILDQDAIWPASTELAELAKPSRERQDSLLELSFEASL